LGGHEHWPAEAVARLLKEAGTEIAREPLRALVFSIERGKIPSVLPWLGRADPVLAGEVAAELLRREAEDPRIVAKALLILQDATLLPSLRRFAQSPDLGVRKNLAMALGELGSLEDVDLVVTLMGDRVWWVRYRAGQALLKLRGMTPERLATIRASLTDRFARDMLDHVTAEGSAP
ncbi:MAG: HEAT repeat domain-containing protein, partial [Steroidobacteraceae bacterium]